MSERTVVFIRKHPDLEPILEETDHVFTEEEVLCIDEHAFLLKKKPTAPLTCTCETGSARYDELKQDLNYIERAFQYTGRKEINTIPVRDEFYWRESHITQRNNSTFNRSF